MGAFDHLPTLADERRVPSATPKHQIDRAIVTKDAKKKSRKQQEEDFRAAVWARDKGICRATGVPLSKSGLDPTRVGEVDHALLRSTNPDRVFDVSNGILIQKYLNRLRKCACPEAPEFKLFDYSGPQDRKKPQRFIWRDRTGKIVKERVG